MKINTFGIILAEIGNILIAICLFLEFYLGDSKYFSYLIFFGVVFLLFYLSLTKIKKDEIKLKFKFKSR